MTFPRLRFQTKVLVPVVSIMVLLVVAPLWLVTQRMSATLESAAVDTLRANDAVFQNLQAIRARDLLLRYRNIPNEPRCKAVLQLSDPKTLRFFLSELREELGVDAVLFLNERAATVASATERPSFPVDDFTRRAALSVRIALDRQPNVDTVGVGGHCYDVISITVAIGEGVVGALVLASEIGEAAAREFTQLTRSEVVLLAGRAIATATMRSPELAERLEAAREALDSPSGDGLAGQALLDGEHYMYVAGHLGQTPPGAGVAYILLSSYEKPLRALHALERRFLWIQLLGMLAGTTVVFGVVRRVVRPLRELRETAEAVGQGDFSRRVTVSSRDECGELASVFNQMTANLRASRQELEETVASLRTTQAQLIQSEKLRAIGTLAGGIAHDFNNILGAILGFGELALDDVAPESRTARNLRQVVKAGQRARELVRQILTFSRQSDPQRAPLRLTAIIDETMKLLRATLPASVELQTQIHTDDAGDTVIGDATQLHQVLMNLGTNAGHAMRETGGRFTLSLSARSTPAGGDPEVPGLPPGPYLCLRANDTGHGMDRNTLQRIFEPFFTTKAVGEGTGLGLSVVHGIIKRHAGEITVTSQVGVGTTFTIYLPRAAATVDAGPAPSESLSPGHRECVLVVDDEEALVNVMEQKLTRLGYEVVACHSGVEALRQFRATPDRFAAVITDQNMPQLTGTDLALEVIRTRPHLPVILCTGSGSALVRTRALKPAIRECVLKPVDFAELSRALRRVIEKKPQAETKQP